MDAVGLFRRATLTAAPVAGSAQAAARAGTRRGGPHRAVSSPRNRRASGRCRSRCAPPAHAPTHRVRSAVPLLGPRTIRTAMVMAQIPQTTPHTRRTTAREPLPTNPAVTPATAMITNTAMNAISLACMPVLFLYWNGGGPCCRPATLKSRHDRRLECLAVRKDVRVQFSCEDASGAASDDGRPGSHRAVNAGVESNSG